MSLTNPILFIIIFLIVVYILDTVYTLLVFAVLLTYIAMDFTAFFTDTMSSDIVSPLQAITGVTATLAYAKMVWIVKKKRESPI